LEKSAEKIKDNKTITKLTKDMTLKEFFESKGLRVIDRRPIGCLWVIGEKDTLDPFVTEAEKFFGVKGNYGVSKAAENKNGWWTKDQK
jgi:hypothetical protein